MYLGHTVLADLPVLIGLECLQPPESAQAPLASSRHTHQAQIVPSRRREIEEFFGDHAGNCVVADICYAGSAVAVAVETRRWLIREESKRLLEDCSDSVHWRKVKWKDTVIANTDTVDIQTLPDEKDVPFSGPGIWSWNGVCAYSGLRLMLANSSGSTTRALKGLRWPNPRNCPRRRRIDDHLSVALSVLRLSHRQSVPLFEV